MSAPTAVLLDDAHYRAAARLTVALDAERDWAGCWRQYLEGYVDACTVPEDIRVDVHHHLDHDFADAALWYREAPGAREGLRALAETGVRLGIVSNADGLIGERLRTHEIVQVGPGVGVVGARRAGLRPFVPDPLGLHHDDGYDRVTSLGRVGHARA